MAKLEITLDTETREMAVRVNGEAIGNVRSVDVYQFPDDEADEGDDEKWQPRFNVVTRETDGGVERRVCLTASDRGVPPTEGVVAASRFPGVFEVRRAGESIARAMEQLLGRGPRR